MATSEVWAGKVNTYYHEVTDEAIRLGQIEFSDLAEGFVKTLRMYNKNASKHIYDPQFVFNGKVYTCSEYGIPSKTGRGTTNYWSLEKTSATRMPVTWGMFGNGLGNIRVMEGYVLTIPKSKVNDRNWRNYIGW